MSNLEGPSHSLTRPGRDIRLRWKEDMIPQESLLHQPITYVGPSGDLDPMLLAHRSYKDRISSVSKYTKATYYRMRPLQQNGGSLLPPAVFTLIEDIPGRQTDLSESSEQLRDELRSRFEEKIDSITASGLLALYLRYVHPVFPIISRHQLPAEEDCVLDIPLGLLAAICATALPFVLYDDALCVESFRLPTQDELFELSWNALVEESSSPSIPTLQGYLLQLHRHYDAKVQSCDALKWSLCCQTISMAQVLGLNEDPSFWITLPGWERHLRKRLWWACWVTEKWIAFGQGMPSHVHQRDFTVDPLTQQDLVDYESKDWEPTSYFVHLVRLTGILDDIMESFFTIRATARMMENVQESLQAARVFRQRLKEWHQNLPPELNDDSVKEGRSNGILDRSPNELNGNASLRIAFFATQLAIFRALIRPVSMYFLYGKRHPGTFPEHAAASITKEFISATMQGAVSRLRDFIGFVERLTTADWDAFWPGWSRHNFALASTLLMHCHLLASSPELGWIPLNPSEIHSVSSPEDITLNNSVLEMDGTNVPTMTPSTQSEVGILGRKWRWILRLVARGAAGKKNLTDISLHRIDALFTEWSQAQISQ
ncbi:hypothetical protein UA08_01329 [Talaromyces atroroseus]|uniref:Xylanolytic transcriptional activator regulatory domain-containing protein n=1 Tax=Talaromyces atroroseus TaxID=1441469 RepID=A0A1Q5QAH9_TALAT|nr:hypothetical protein UA08_01329 [Talaromyces atroroseus]OKL62769.1 hypothetical protein UA08_01329 [Talaromyces atroroseus]